MNSNTHSAANAADPSSQAVERVIAEAERTLAESADSTPPQTGEREGAAGSTASPLKPKAARSRLRAAAVTAAGVAGGEKARRVIVDAVDRDAVIAVARRVATRQLNGATDAEVLRFIADNDGFRKSLAGHLHEHLDAADLKRIYDLRNTLHLSEGRWLKLYAEHNRKGLDGAYMGARKAGDACFTQHKLSENPQQLKNAAAKVDRRVRGKVELVVARGTKENVAPKTTTGLKGVREAGRSAKGIRGMVEKLADPKKVTDVGAKAAQKFTPKAGAVAGGAAAGISVACDLNRLRKGETTASEVVENAAWAGGEAALCTVATAGATAAAASTMAAGVTVLAGSTIAGTTVMAAGLAALGPVGLGIGIGVGFGVKKVRKGLRG